MKLGAIIGKAAYDSLAPELKEAYVKDEANPEQYILDVEEKEYKTKLNEFRSNNVQLTQTKKTLEEQLARFKDVDPEEYEKAKKALDVLNETEEGRLIKEGKLEEVVNRRLETAKRDLERVKTNLTTENNDLKQKNERFKNRLRQLVRDTEITKAVGNIGTVKKGALFDVLTRASEIFDVDDDGVQLVARKPGSDEPVYGADGKTPLTPDEWGKQLLDAAPHLFEGGEGGGATGGKKGGFEGRRKTIDGSDPLEIGRNLKDIADGKVNVTTVSPTSE